MELGKFRSENQISEDKSIRIFLKWLPSEWIWRMVTPDYGIDLEIEFVEPKSSIDLNGNKIDIEPNINIVTGDIIWIQLKSTQKVEETNEYIKYSVDKSLLWYAASCSIPIILVLVELGTERIFWIHLQQYLRDCCQRNDFKWWLNESNKTLNLDKSKCINYSKADTFNNWRYIANEISVIKQLAILQSILFDCIRTLDKIEKSLDRKTKMQLVSTLSDDLSSCFCLGVLFHDSYYKEAIEVRNRIIDPLIDNLDECINKKNFEFDYTTFKNKIYELLDFACNWVKDFSIQ